MPWVMLDATSGINNRLQSFYAFYGHGIRGPCVYLRDNAEAEFKALQAVFPESRNHLCQFHLLQGAVPLFINHTFMAPTGAHGMAV